MAVCGRAYDQIYPTLARVQVPSDCQHRNEGRLKVATAKRPRLGDSRSTAIDETASAAAEAQRLYKLDELLRKERLGLPLSLVPRKSECPYGARVKY